MIDPTLTNATDLFPFSGAALTNVLINTTNSWVVEGGTPRVTGSYAAGNLVLYSQEWNRFPGNGIFVYNFFTNGNTPLPLPWNLNNIPTTLSVSTNCTNSYQLNQPVRGSPHTATLRLRALLPVFMPFNQASFIITATASSSTTR